MKYHRYSIKSESSRCGTADGNRYDYTGTRRAIRPIPFGGKILIVGCGAVSQCLQPLLLRHLQMDFSKVTILDMVADKPVCRELIAAGARFVQLEINKNNMATVLEQFVDSGDAVIDLAWNIDTVAIVDWCQRHNVLYVNTSIEVWDPYIPGGGISVADDTIYARHVALSNYTHLQQSNRLSRRSTAVIEHGANPGLVNHWVKMGLEHLTAEILQRIPMTVERRSALEQAFSERNHALMAMHTGTKVVHISERDSQSTNLPIDYRSEFVNTWSVESFLQESVSPPELAWGTHERRLPHNAVHHRFGPKNKIYLDSMAMDTRVYSWVPSGEIVGQISAHGEVFSISKNLTVECDQQIRYRPSVYFVYKPSDAALACLQMQKYYGCALPEETRVMTSEIIDGADEVGVLLLGHDLGAWWIGSTLDIHEARRHVTDQNATTLQVAASALAAVIYAIENPSEGINTSDTLPHEKILGIADRYLGKCLSIQSNWRPPSVSCSDKHGNIDAWGFERFIWDSTEHKIRRAG